MVLFEELLLWSNGINLFKYYYKEVFDGFVKDISVGDMCMVLFEALGRNLLQKSYMSIAFILFVFFTGWYVIQQIVWTNVVCQELRSSY